jgi:hypothetical protein
MSHHGGTETRSEDGEEKTRVVEKTEERGRGESGERAEERPENDEFGE